MEPQLHEQQEQPSEQPQPGPSQFQPPLAAVLPKTLTMQDKINRQMKAEQLVCNPSFKGHPKYDMSLNYKLQNHANLYKLVSYNPKTKTYRAMNLGIDKQNLSVPFYLLTGNLENSEDSYIRNLEQSFLKERYKTFNSSSATTACCENYVTIVMETFEATNIFRLFELGRGSKNLFLSKICKP